MFVAHSLRYCVAQKPGACGEGARPAHRCTISCEGKCPAGTLAAAENWGEVEEEGGSVCGLFPIQ